jgi:hypothetical protein
MKNEMRLIVGVLVGAAAALCTLPEIARGQIYVTNYGSNTIGKYDSATGATLDASFITGLSQPWGIAVSQGILYVANFGNSTIGKYDAATGAALNASFITVLGGYHPRGISISGGELVVANHYANISMGKISKYDVVTGTTLNDAFITGVSAPVNIAISNGILFVSKGTSTDVISKYDVVTGTTLNDAFITGLYSGSNAGIAVTDGNLFVSNKASSSTIGKYDVATGTTLNDSFITGLANPGGIEVSDGYLFVANTGAHTIRKYDLATGVSVNAPNTSFITGLQSPRDIVLVSAVPEPSTYAALAGLAALGFTTWRRRCKWRKSSANATAGES